MVTIFCYQFGYIEHQLRLPKAKTMIGIDIITHVDTINRSVIEPDLASVIKTAVRRFYDGPTPVKRILAGAYPPFKGDLKPKCQPTLNRLLIVRSAEKRRVSDP